MDVLRSLGHGVAPNVITWSFFGGVLVSLIGCEATQGTDRSGSAGVVSLPDGGMVAARAEPDSNGTVRLSGSNLQDLLADLSALRFQIEIPQVAEGEGVTGAPYLFVDGHVPARGGGTAINRFFRFSAFPTDVPSVILGNPAVSFRGRQIWNWDGYGDYFSFSLSDLGISGGIPISIPSDIGGVSLFLRTFGSGPYPGEIPQSVETTPSSGGARVAVDLCYDADWPTSQQYHYFDSPPTVPLFRDCGPLGWVSGPNGRISLRIPFRVRLEGISLEARFTCPPVIPYLPDGILICAGAESPSCGSYADFVGLDRNDPSLRATACRQIRDTLADPAIAAITCPVCPINCFQDRYFRYAIWTPIVTSPTGVPPTNYAGGYFSIDQNFDLMPCAPVERPDLLRDATPTTPAIQYCPHFPDEASNPTSNIHPTVAIVPRQGNSLFRRVDNGSALPFSSLVMVDGSVDHPTCANFASLVNNTLERNLGDARSRIDGTILPNLVSALFPSVSSQLNGFLQSFKRPDRTPEATAIRRPTCDSSLTSTDPAGCQMQWASYSFARIIYQYITGPFDGAPGSPTLRWSTARVEPPSPGSGTHRNDLVVQTERVSRPRPTCNPEAIGITRNLRLDPFEDTDGDGITNQCDNCPFSPNVEQRNCNGFAEQRLAIRRGAPRQLGVDLRGDACDPSPCGEIQSVVRGRVNGGLGIPDPIGPARVFDARIRLVDSLRTDGWPNDPSRVVNQPLQIRRCACVDTFTRQPISLDQCENICPRDGILPTPQIRGEGFQMADWSVGASTFGSVFDCPRDGVTGRCLDSSNHWYLLDADSRGISNTAYSAFTLNFFREFSSDTLLPRPGVISTMGTSSFPVRVQTRASSSSEFASEELTRRDNYNDSLSVVANDSARGSPPDTYLPNQIICGLDCGSERFSVANRVSWFVQPPFAFAQDDTFHVVSLLPLPRNPPLSMFSLRAQGGDINPEYSGLGIGILDPIRGRWLAIGASSGDLPPVSGTAFAIARSSDGVPHVFGVGGIGPNGISNWLYDGTVTATTATTAIRWRRQPLSQVNAISNAVAGTGPIARRNSSVASAPDGTHLFVYGGWGVQGPLNDLWDFNTTTNVWSQIQIPDDFVWRLSPSITADTTRVAIYGGVDPQGHRLGDSLVLYPETNTWSHVELALAPREGAAIYIKDNHLEIYGGTTETEVSDEIAQVDIFSGNVASTSHTGVPSGRGSALTHDASGRLFVAMGEVASEFSATAILTGTISQMQRIVLQLPSDIVPRCGNSHYPNLGFPCQAQDSWFQMPGFFACNANGRLSCVGSRSGIPDTWRIDQVDAWDLSNSILAFAQDSMVRIYSANEQPHQISSIELNARVHAIALAEGLVLVGTNDRLMLYRQSATDTAISTPMASSNLCGIPSSITLGAGVITVDTSTGVEFFRFENGRIFRDDFSLACADDLSAWDSNEDRSDGTALERCPELNNNRASHLRNMQRERSIAVTDDGTIWISEGHRLVAIRPDPRSHRLRVAGVQNIGTRTLQIRAAGTDLAVIGTSVQGGPLTPFVRLTSSRNRTEISIRGQHGMTSWVTSLPKENDRWIIRQHDRSLEVASALR